MEGMGAKTYGIAGQNVLSADNNMCDMLPMIVALTPKGKNLRRLAQSNL
jgi:hypothetical protein